MASGTRENGDGGDVHRVPANHLIVSVEFNPFHVHIAGKVDSDELAVAILRQALDYYEARIRFKHGLICAQEYAKEVETAALVASLKR